MSWDEFYDLLSGLDADMPLGKIVQIRTETDKDMLESFTPGQRKIRAEWQHKVAKNRSKDETMSFVLAMQQALKNMSTNGGE